MIKINSKFKDYYDSAIGSFPDSDVVYNRTPEIVSYDPRELPSLGEDFDGRLYSAESFIRDCDPDRMLKLIPSSHLELYSFWVGFAGHYYPFVAAGGTFGEMVWSRLDPGAIEEPLKYLNWGSFFDPGVRRDVMPTSFETVKRYSSFEIDFDRHCGIKIPAKVLNNEFKNPEETEFWKDEAFDKFGPIFMAVFPVQSKYTLNRDKRRIWIFKNICLKSIGFQKIMDPYRALLSLENWLDSHARPDDAVVPVGDDITRIKAYGFDPRTSFRKGKEK